MILSLLITLLIANAGDRTARLYEIGKTDGTPLFTQTWKTKTLPNGDVQESATITDSTGTVAMTQTALFNGSILKSQTTTQLQTLQSYKIDVTGNLVRFESSSLDPSGAVKSKSQNELSVSGSFLTGPVTENFILQNWERLATGESLKVQFGVPEMRDTVTFLFRKKIATQTNLLIEMVPKNFLIRLMLSPIEIHFVIDGKKLKRLKGRTPLKRNINGSLKHFDAEIIYD